MANSKRITLREIAHRADTSTMAVSVVLNGARSNTRVSDATRRRITEIAADLNYSPNALAQGLKRQRTGTLGVLFNWAGKRAIHNFYSMTILDGIVEGAAAAGYHVLLYTTAWRSAAESSTLFSDRRTDGIVVVAPQEPGDTVSGLVSLGLPVVVLSSFTEVAGVPYIAIDNQAGVRMALDHLRALGHTQIAFAGHEPSRTSMRERQETYVAWMREQGLSTPDTYFRTAYHPGDTKGNAERLKQLLRSTDRPTAIFAVTDDLAAEVLDAARGVGLSVPEQLSVVGFDDIPVASLAVPKLTTVRLPLLDMGKQAANLLIEVIEEKSDDTDYRHITTPELIIRESTAPAPHLRS
jgi:LacI family transcriptional regulator